MEFSDALASAIHDIKNSLGMVLHTVEELTADPDGKLAGDPRAIAMQLEARRASSHLIQLLTLYKLEKERFVPNILEHDVDDFLDDLVVEHKSLAAARGIGLEYDCATGLCGYFDQDLIRGVLNDAIGNAERYTKSRIMLVANQQNGYLVISVEDDGVGFPRAMLELQHALEGGRSFGTGRTNLGLYFSHQVARAHKDGERIGMIRLDNRCHLEGGCFSIWLP